LRTWSTLLCVLLFACDGKTPEPEPEDSEQDSEPVVDTEPDSEPTGESCTYLEFNARVEPAFNAGPLWGDWVLASSSTQDCEPTGRRCDDCWHGGELRVIEVETDCTCDDVTVRDSAGALRWSCSAPGGRTLELTSGFFIAGKGLADLIDPSVPAWRPLSVRVTAGELEAESDPDVWWTNPVRAIPEDGVLNRASNVYVATEDGAGALTITADSVSLLIPPGVTWTGPGTGAAVVSGEGVSRAWIEGTIDATDDRAAIELEQAPVTTVHGATLLGPTATGPSHGAVLLSGATGSQLTHSSVPSGAGVGARLTDSDGSCVQSLDLGPLEGVGVHVESSDRTQVVAVVAHQVQGYNVHIDRSADAEVGLLRQYDAGDVGLYTTASNDLHVSSLRAFNGAGPAVQIDPASQRAVLLDLLSVGGDGDGLQINGPEAVLSQVTVASHAGDGVHLQGDGAVLAAAVLTGNGGAGLRDEGDRQTLVDLASAHNGGHGLVLTGTQIQITGGLLLGGNVAGDCSDAVPASGVSAACANEGASNATLRTGVSLTTSFVGQVDVDDAVNAADLLGAAPYDTLTDWTGYEHALRGWSLQLAFPSASTAGRCGAGDDCRIFDWALVETGATLLGALPAPDGDDVVVHTWAASTEGACDDVDGTWGGSACTSTFLRHAQETLADAFGNDNGLCESVDSCYYLPNLGAYQGHGPIIRGPAFVDGVVEQVTLRQLRFNGRPPLP
jgi:hypothetical protein